MSESELDRLLGAWLNEGSDTTPDRIAENAVLEIATVPQERDVLGVLQASFSGAPLAWAAGILALAVAIGVILGPRLIGEPSPTPNETPGPSQSAGPSETQSSLDRHQSVTSVGTIDWTRIESDLRIFPSQGTPDGVLGYSVDENLETTGWWMTQDGITWREADPGASDFWPAALAAGDDTLSVLSYAGCGQMMGPASYREVYARICVNDPTPAAMYRLENGAWVDVGIPPGGSPAVPGLRTWNRQLSGVAGLNGLNWIAPSSYLLDVPWADVYGVYPYTNPFDGSEATEIGPWPNWNDLTEQVEIRVPGTRTVIATLTAELADGQIEFRAADSGDLVYAVPATLPGWTQEALLTALRGWGLEDVSFIVSRDGVIEEVRPPWEMGEEWSGAIGTAFGRYFTTSYVVGESYTTTQVHLWESADGASWAPIPVPPFAQLPEYLELTGSPNQLLLSAHNPDSVWVTTDARIWEEIPPSDMILIGGPTPTDFGWLMGGFDATSISGDGVNWAPIDLPELPAEPFVSYLNGIFFYGPELVGDRSVIWIGQLTD